MKIRKETVQLLYMKRLIYLKNEQSLDLLVSPLKLLSHDFVDHVAHGFKTKGNKCQAIVRV